MAYAICFTTGSAQKPLAAKNGEHIEIPVSSVTFANFISINQLLIENVNFS